MEIPRHLRLPELLEKKSFFLFGPRATGKTTLIRRQLPNSALVIDLLDSRNYLTLSARPYELESIIKARAHDCVVIDEIQRIPDLLNEVHRLIESQGITFLLTGSSARKLRRGQANLLAGRVWEARLFPLCWKEIPRFDLDRYLRYGGLPAVYLSDYPEEELNAYVNTYLSEEIQAEGLVRKLPPFSRFLETIALASGEMINLTSLGNDCQVAPSTVRQYLSLLEDTLLGFMLPAWTKSKKRKAIRRAKFYLFDPGITHTLCGTEHLERNSNLYGKAFEHFIGMELRAWLSYRRDRRALSYWRSTHGQEVDFVIGSDLAVEVKASARIGPADFRGLRALQQEGIIERLFLVSQDPLARNKDGIQAMHWEEFLDALWSDGLEGSTAGATR